MLYFFDAATNSANNWAADPYASLPRISFATIDPLAGDPDAVHYALQSPCTCDELPELDMDGCTFHGCCNYCAACKEANICRGCGTELTDAGNCPVCMEIELREAYGPNAVMPPQ